MTVKRNENDKKWHKMTQKWHKKWHKYALGCADTIMTGKWCQNDTNTTHFSTNRSWLCWYENDRKMSWKWLEMLKQRCQVCAKGRRLRLPNPMQLCAGKSDIIYLIYWLIKSRDYWNRINKIVEVRSQFGHVSISPLPTAFVRLPIKNYDVKSKIEKMNFVEEITLYILVVSIFNLFKFLA